MTYATMVLWGQKLSLSQNEYGTIAIMFQQRATEEEKLQMESMPQSFSTDAPIWRRE